MLVLVSDLHLTDGTTANNFNPEAFDILGERIISAARSRGALEVRLVLLGDIVDLVRTDYWLRQGIPMNDRPWGGNLDPTTGMNANGAIEPQFRAVLDDVIVHAGADPNCGFGPMLARLDAECDDFAATYVIGNHDRVLYNFPSLQARLQQVYPQIDAFVPVYENADYSLVARHGHEWDDNCHGFEFQKKVLKATKPASRFDLEAYKTMAIGEVVTAELMGGLIYHTDDLGGGPDLVARLREVNNLRPMISVFAWLEWFGGAKDRAEKKILHDALDLSLKGVLASTVARKWDRMKRDFLVSGDLVDRFQYAQRNLLGNGFAEFQRRVRGATTLQSLLGEADHLLDGAISEYGSKPTVAPDTQFLVYGHSHRARRDYFHAELDGRVQMYVNTGTFMPLITRAADKRTFAEELQMTMVFVYREDEDIDRKQGGPSIDIWNGTRRKQYA